MVGDGDWFGWRRLVAFEKSLMNLRWFKKRSNVTRDFTVCMRCREVSSSVIRYSKRERERKRREAAPRKERRKKRLKTATKTETSLTSRCERSVETEEGVKRWWRRQLKGDGDGGVEARWVESGRKRSSCGSGVVVVHG